MSRRMDWTRHGVASNSAAHFQNTLALKNPIERVPLELVGHPVGGVRPASSSYLSRIKRRRGAMGAKKNKNPKLGPGNVLWGVPVGVTVLLREFQLAL